MKRISLALLLSFFSVIEIGAANYLFAQKLDFQTITSNFTTIVNFIPGPNNGWGLNSTKDTFTVPATGIYQIEYNAIADVPAAAIRSNIIIRTLINGAYTKRGVGVARSLESLRTLGLISQCFQISLTKGDKLKLQVARTTSLAGAKLAPTVYKNVFSPSVTLSITRLK